MEKFKMFYIEKDNKILMFAQTQEEIQIGLEFAPVEYQDLEIKETDRPIINFEFADTPEYLEKELEKAKQTKIQENDIERDVALNAGVVYKDVLFDSDTDQKVNLLAMVSAMSDEDTIVWYGKDNQPLECNKEDLTNIGILITQLHTFCWTKNAEIKAEIAEASTFEELNTIDIDYNME